MFQVASELKLEFRDQYVERQFLHGQYVSRQHKCIYFIDNMIYAGPCEWQYNIHGKFRTLKNVVSDYDQFIRTYKLCEQNLVDTYIVRNSHNLRVEFRGFDVIKSIHSVHKRYIYVIIDVNVEFGNASTIGIEVLAAPSTLKEQRISDQHHRVL